MRPTVSRSRRRGGGGAPPISAPDWEVYRSFNDGTVGTAANGTADGFDGEATQSVYSTEQVFAGGQACKTTVTEGTTGFGTFGGIIDFPTYAYQGDTIWYQHYLWMPTGFLLESPVQPGQLKYLRFREYTTGGSSPGYLDLYLRGEDTLSAGYRYRVIKEVQATWFASGPAGGYPRDQWVKQTVCFTVDSLSQSNGGVARFRLWENDDLIFDSNGTILQTVTNAANHVRQVNVFTYWADLDDGGAQQTQSVFLDEIRIAKNGTPTWVQGLEGVS